MKILYKFIANKTQKVEEKTDNGDGSFTTKLVDKPFPVEIYLKHPSRRDREDISVFYNGAYGAALKKGLQTADVIRRCLLDSGGTLAQHDLEQADQLLKELTLTANAIQEALLEKKDDSDLQKQYSELLEAFEKIERSQREVFSKSAEAHAQNKTVEWCVLNFTFTQNEKKEYVYVFPGPTDEAKLSTFYEWADDEKHEFELGIHEKATVCYYHYIMADKSGQEYFDSIFGVVKDEAGTAVP